MIELAICYPPIETRYLHFFVASLSDFPIQLQSQHDFLNSILFKAGLVKLLLCSTLFSELVLISNVFT